MKIDFRPLTRLACEQAPKWGIGRKEILASRASGAGCSISVFTLNPTWEPVHRLTQFLCQIVPNRPDKSVRVDLKIV